MEEKKKRDVVSLCFSLNTFFLSLKAYFFLFTLFCSFLLTFLLLDFLLSKEHFPSSSKTLYVSKKLLLETVRFIRGFTRMRANRTFPTPYFVMPACVM